MFICKLFGMFTLVYAFMVGVNKWFEDEKNDNLLGLIISFMIITGAIYGFVYLVNN